MRGGELSLTSTLATFLFSSHPKIERARKAYLNYYANDYNRGRQLSHRNTKLTQNERNKPNPGSIASYDLLPGNGVVTIVVERDGQKKKIGKANKKRKKRVNKSKI